MQVASKSFGLAGCVHSGSVGISRTRLAKVQTWLKENNMDAALFSNLTNVGYLTGFSPAGVDPNEVFLVVTPGKAALWASPFYEAKAKRIAPHLSVQTGKLDDFLKAQLGSAASVGVEKNNASWHLGERLRTLLPGAKFAEMEFVEQMRMVKTQGEKEAMQKAVAITGKAMEAVARHAHPRTTESRLAAIYRKALLNQHAEESFTTIMGAGPHGAEPHYDEMDDTPLGKGTLVVMDVGARVRPADSETIDQGYDSDITRMIVIGKPSQEQKKILALVEKAQEAAIAMVAPGVPIREVDAAARKVIEAAGHGPEFFHGTGHGVGREVHELPWVSPSTPPDQILKPGEVITVEPGVYLKGKFGVRLEDMVLVTETGHEVLSGDIPKIFYRSQGILGKMESAWEKVKAKFLSMDVLSFLSDKSRSAVLSCHNEMGRDRIR